MQEPTNKQCDEKIEVGPNAFACYYPQTDGHSSKCVVKLLFDTGMGCFDAYIWHDGEFPYSDGKPPVELHHCDPEQFIRFGAFIKKKYKQERNNDDQPDSV